jgi:hypothetical protein
MTVAPYLDPFAQRARVLEDIRTWRVRYAGRPRYLLDAQISALLRLVDRLDDLIGDEPPNLPPRHCKDGRHDQTGR